MTAPIMTTEERDLFLDRLAQNYAKQIDDVLKSGAIPEDFIANPTATAEKREFLIAGFRDGLHSLFAQFVGNGLIRMPAPELTLSIGGGGTPTVDSIGIDNLLGRKR